MRCIRITGKRGPLWRLKVPVGDTSLIFFGGSCREVFRKYLDHCHAVRGGAA